MFKDVLGAISSYLALYGAIVGTLALLLNWLKFRHTVGKEKIKLKFSIEKASSYDESIQALINPDPRRITGVKALYNVDVTNTGGATLYLRDVRVVCEGDVCPMQALTPGNHHLVKIHGTSRATIPAKSTQQFTIWADTENFDKPRLRVEVVDGVGKVWKMKFPKYLR